MRYVLVLITLFNAESISPLPVLWHQPQEHILSTIIVPYCCTHLVHLRRILCQHFPVFDGLYFNLSGDAMPLAMLTQELNAVGVPIDIWVVLPDPGDRKIPGDSLL